MSGQLDIDIKTLEAKIYKEAGEAFNIGNCEETSLKGLLDVFLEAKENGKAIIFSTHHLDEVERLCDRVVIIHKGRLQHNGDINSALAATNQARLADAFFNLVNV